MSRPYNSPCPQSPTSYLYDFVLYLSFPTWARVPSAFGL